MSSSNNSLPTPASNSSTRIELRKGAVGANGEVILTEINDKVIVNSKDLGNTDAIRGESMFEKSKFVEESRKVTATPTIAYQRKRKHVSRSGPTPKWQTVLSIVTKFCLLIVGIFWLGQMILKMSNGDSTSYPFDDFDGRIARVESFVKKTAKMVQDKIGDVDMKIESQIGAALKELGRRIEENSLMWEKELTRLEVRNDDLSKSLDGLKEMGFLTKEEFESFKNELKKRRGFYGSDEDVNLEEIGALAKEIVAKEIEKHVADGLGRVDYALASGGGRVIMHSEPFVSGKASNWFGVGKDRGRVHPNTKKMLEPSFGEPGQCFALQGSSGYVDIRLRAGIIPEAVTLEHVSKSVAYDRSSAPKDCVISAWFEGSNEPKHLHVLTKFSYDLEKSNAQTFSVDKTNISAVNVMRLEFTANHGNPSHTCIYRFRVHGYEYKMLQLQDSETSEENTENDASLK